MQTQISNIISNLIEQKKTMTDKISKEKANLKLLKESINSNQ
jgi:hypothetical protein